jgi:ribosome-associated protein
MSSADPPPFPEEALSEMRRGKLPRSLQSRLGDATSFSFIASSGPGGQNVNKVATAVQLRCDVFKLGLAPPVHARLKQLAGSRMTSGGEIVITARTHRSQDANRAEARARLAELIAKAHVRPEKRVKTKPSRAAKAKRVDDKKQRGAVKGARAKPRID